MASSLLALLDDIATVLDDVATMSALAAKKTAGVLGDDLALNAQQLADLRADRELPVVWAVARGSLVNKAVLVPVALLVSAWSPALVLLLLMLGGLYLCFEAAEKLVHRLRHGPAPADPALQRALADPGFDLAAHERAKIRAAVRTDFVLSAEIVVIALGQVAELPLATRIAVLSAVALLMTVGVYGLVAAIVKLDDAGWLLQRRASAAARALGAVLLALAPRLMRALAVIGTVAMFSVGGSILVHGWHWLHAMLALRVTHWLATLVAELALGVAAGLLVLAVVTLARRIVAPRASPA